MKQEYKLLLLKDLCARLPYGVKIMHNNNPKNPYAITAIRENDGIWGYTIEGHLGWFGIDETSRPYLRPLSGMTGEEKEEVNSIFSSSGVEFNITKGNIESVEIFDNGTIYYDVVRMTDYIDFLNAHHFDYRGLIKKGLALAAPEGTYELNNM